MKEKMVNFTHNRKIQTLVFIIFWSILLSCVTLIYPLTADALMVEAVPNPRQMNEGWVTDMADILDYKTEIILNNLITQLEVKNGAEIAIVTVTDTKPFLTPKQFTTQLFNYWGIGKKGENNGVLFLISLGDRRVEIETGSGIDTLLSQTYIKDIIDNKIRPQFKQKNYNQGILEGTKALIVELDRQLLLNQDTRDVSKKELSSFRKNVNLCIVILTMITVHGLVIILVEKYKKKRQNSLRFLLGDQANTPGYGHSYSGGTGGSFGGGESSGGGAGGSW
ncbi:hypothetical protein cce_2042 [Crocosphaera subtropica ATCC 51142]|uniref:TPM domain-containing protein n=2 Tax=Crocosphaera TaxID=263510 RepID=B1X1G3_CROS5|nr:hypothetical protein cce_2042 [Crocosphaera subtropica ATCC 51142]